MTGASRPITGIGLCVVDHVYEVDDFELSQTRTRYRERLISPGGMATNALTQAAALGMRASLISMVGDDPDGRFLRTRLREAGVATRALLLSREHPTTTAVVLVERGSGERRFVLPDRRRIERHAPDFDLSSIRRGSVLLVDGHFARQTQRAVERGRSVGADIIADFSDARPSHRRLLSKIDYPIMPEEFVESWGVGGARETLRALHEISGGRATPVVTLGRRGALALVDGRFRRVRPRRARVRDTTGAGDAFRGGFASGIALGLPVLDALELASRAAASCCGALGAQGRLLSRADL